MIISVRFINEIKIMINQTQIRGLLRKAGNEFVTVPIASQILKRPFKTALEILTDLEKQGIIDATNIEGHWTMSLRGKVLIHKKMAREFKIETQRLQLKAFLNRVAFINSSLKFPDYISCIKITSEYPIKNNSTGIHIAYSLNCKKVTRKAYKEAADKLRAEYSGTFTNTTQYAYYPHEAIHILLKSRSHVLKLRACPNEAITQLNGIIVFEVQQQD